MTECIFCRIVEKELPAQIVWEDELALGFRDLSPQAPCHILVIPKKHIPSIGAATDSDKDLMGHLLLACRKIAESEGLGSEFRLVTNTGASAGQSVFHLHIHLLGGRPFGWPPG
jgi:histidine triad (HIT) family protein